MCAVVKRAWVHGAQALERVQASERKFRSIIDVSPVPMALNDDKLNITYLTPAFTATFGYTLHHIPNLEQWWPKAYPDIAYRQQVQRLWSNEIARVMATGEGFRPMQVQVRCLDGSDRQVLANADKLTASLSGEHVVVLYDISSQMKSVQALNALVKDKNALLKEVHHRVKNNLQVISSLLRLEAHRVSKTEVATALNDMRWRIRSMALLHESLYRSESFASIDLSAYLRQLANEVLRALTESDSSVSLTVDTQPVTASMDQATPCGLILYELLSNALKHGFPSGRIGLLMVSLTKLDSARVRLTVSDNGVGLPADFERRKTNSLGLQLVSDLVQQLGGNLTIGPVPLASFSIEFLPDSE
jgi:PAS domain S-box-containing protein